MRSCRLAAPVSLGKKRAVRRLVASSIIATSTISSVLRFSSQACIEVSICTSSPQAARRSRRRRCLRRRFLWVHSLGLDLLVLCSQSLFRFADVGDDGLCRGGPDKGCGVIVSAIAVVVDRLD